MGAGPNGRHGVDRPSLRALMGRCRNACAQAWYMDTDPEVAATLSLASREAVSYDA